MPIGNLIVVGAIVSVFLIFMLVLGVVAWWSGQAPKPRRAGGIAVVKSDRKRSDVAALRAH